MSSAREAAARAGVSVEIAGLGDWGRARLIAEYDPNGPVIRIDARELAAASDPHLLEELAIAHELYHHFERTAGVPRLRSRRAREAAADAYARAFVER
ncbi:MAG: hypothetical protein WCE44_04070 [Candidatus Velthaea sp.]|jgi:hypothetical protein